MAKKIVKNYTLYKLRFWLGYGALAVAISIVLLTGALYTPGGITAAEEEAVIKSASLSFTDPSSALIIDLPYHALQKLSIALFGLSSLSIKLPSLILGALSIIGLILVMKRRFTHTIGILAVGIVVVSAKFISIATTGTPEIMRVFWPVVFLLIAVYGIKANAFRTSAVLLGGLALGLSLFTPFSVYVILALCVGASLHPRVRYLLRRTPNTILATGGAICLTGVFAVIFAATRDIAFVQQLLYKSSSFSLDIVTNLKLIGLQLGDVASHSTEETGILTPVIGISVATIGLIGAYALLKARHTVLSYTLFTWTSLLTPLFIFNPESFSLLIVPIAFFLALGTSFILQYWYKLFPKNPYARIFALIPASILFSCIIIPSAFHYFYSYNYFAPLANTYHNDLTLASETLEKHPGASLIVSNQEAAFYRVYLDANSKTNKLITVDETSVDSTALTQTQTAIATRTASKAIASSPAYIVASPSLNTPSDRFYVYKISRE